MEKEAAYFEKVDISKIILISVNILPLIGILFFSLEFYTIFLAYAAEIFIIGFFSLIKIFVFGIFKKSPEKIKINAKYLSSLVFLSFTMVIIPCILAFLVLYSLIGSMTLFQIVNIDNNPQINQARLDHLIILLSGFFFGHLASLLYNFVYKQEYNKLNSLLEIIISEYKRMIYLVVVAPAGLILTIPLFYFSSNLNTHVPITDYVPFILTAIFIASKIYLDTSYYKKVHENILSKE
ncbi:MAG: DUF6498-containing protein [Candidatus Nanoarchaeia archaeon]